MRSALGSSPEYDLSLDILVDCLRDYLAQHDSMADMAQCGCDLCIEADRLAAWLEGRLYEIDRDPQAFVRLILGEEITLTTDGGFKPSTAAPLGASPLRKFRGRLVSFEKVDRTFEPREGETGGPRISTSIKHSFDEVEPIEVTEPYPFPIAYVSINYSDPARESNRGGTRWDAWSGSMRRILGRAPDYEELTGKYMTCFQGPAEIRQQDPETKKWGMVEADCWQVESIEGLSAAAGSAGDIMEYVAGLGNGKNEQELYEVLLTDSRARQNQDIVSAITSRKLVETLLASGKMVRNAEGILTKAT